MHQSVLYSQLSISKFNLPFSRLTLKIVQFICVEGGLYLRNYALLLSCYLSFHLASKFSLTLRFTKTSSTSDSVLRRLLGLRPWYHWGLPYSKPYETAAPPPNLRLRSTHEQHVEGVVKKDNWNGVSHSIPVDQRI